MKQFDAYFEVWHIFDWSATKIDGISTDHKMAAQ